MIRWRFVVVRLVILVAIVLVLQSAFGPVARYAAVRLVSASTGAKVDIDRCEVGLFPPRVRCVSMAVADPRDGKSMRNLMTADSIDLTIDGSALLRRRLVIDQAQVSGLELGSRRTTDGHFEYENEPESDDDGSPGVLSTWIAGMGGQVGDAAETFRDDLETVRRSRQIADDWQRRYDEAMAEAKSIEQQIRDIRDGVRGIDNPLRDWARAQQTVGEMNSLRERLVSVRGTIDELPKQFRRDLDSMDDAKAIDLAKIDEFVPGDLSEADDIGVGLIADAVREQIATLRGYLESGRSIADYTVVAPEASERHRGRDLDFDKLDLPEVLVRRCGVNGVFRRGGDLYDVDGYVYNVTPSPRQSDEPMRARLRLDGPDLVRLDYVRDRRGDVPRDVVTLHWPDLSAGGFQLGRPDDAAISVRGGRRELWVRVETRGDDVRGHLVSKQTGVSMSLAADASVADTPAVRSMNESLAAIDRVEIDANFEGTWGDLDIDFESNLGRAIKLAATRAIRTQVAESKAEVRRRIQDAYAQETAKLQNRITGYRGGTANLVGGVDKIINDIQREMVGDLGEADAYIGRMRDPLKSLLR